MAGTGPRIAVDCGTQHGRVGHGFPLEVVVRDDDHLLGLTFELPRPIEPRLELFGRVQIVVPFVDTGVVAERVIEKPSP